MEFNKKDERVARLIKATFPGWKGRRPVKVYSKLQYHLSDYHNGGSRDYAEFVNVRTGQHVNLDSLNYEHQSQGNPFNLRIGNVELTPEIAVVENVIFCGKDLGIRIHLHPDTYKEWEKY